MTSEDESYQTHREDEAPETHREDDGPKTQRQNDGPKTQREDGSGGEGRQTQRQDGRDGWTPDAETPQRKGDVTPGEPTDADAETPESEQDEDASASRSGDEVSEGSPDSDVAFDPPLETREFPMTTDELGSLYGDYRVATDDGSRPLPDLLEAADGETFGSADEVRSRIESLADRS